MNRVASVDAVNGDKMQIKQITIATDGTVNLDLPLKPEVFAMLVRYKAIKGTTDTSIEDSINNILNDFLLERLSKPTVFKSLKTLDKFDLEAGK